MSDDLIIKSLFREYRLFFVNNFTEFLAKETDNDAFVIIDKIVYELYQEIISPFLKEGRFFIIEANERNKSLDKCKELIEELVEKGMRRDKKLIAIGGGVIQDITAFTASILYRGVEWVFFPTTLLAQADSCLGSKTSINLGDKKNLIGNFYPPSEIFIDNTFLKTLSVEDIKSGIGEMLHFYFYSKSPYIDRIVNDYDLLIKNRDLLKEYMIESLSIKKSVAEIDEFDKGERNKFNYGHTFGHALESVTDYQIKHGQAVTVGMDIANYISWKKGFIEESKYREINKKLIKNFPLFDWKSINMDKYMSALSKDKKNTGNNVGCIMIGSSGKLEKLAILNDENFKKNLEGYFKLI